MQLKIQPRWSLWGAFRNTTSPKCRGFTWAEWHILKIKPGLGLTCKLLIRSIYSHPAVMGETCSSVFLLSLCRITGTFLLLPLARTLQPWELSSSRTAAIPSDRLHTLILYSDNILLQVNDPSKTSCSLKELLRQKNQERGKRISGLKKDLLNQKCYPSLEFPTPPHLLLPKCKHIIKN